MSFTEELTGLPDLWGFSYTSFFSVLSFVTVSDEFVPIHRCLSTLEHVFVRDFSFRRSFPKELSSLKKKFQSFHSCFWNFEVRPKRLFMFMKIMINSSCNKTGYRTFFCDVFSITNMNFLYRAIFIISRWNHLLWFIKNIIY